MFKVIILDAAKKDLVKMDKFEARKVLAYLQRNIDGSLDPQRYGRSLKNLSPKDWRYRVGQVRILCELDLDNQFVYVHAVINRDKSYR